MPGIKSPPLDAWILTLVMFSHINPAPAFEPVKATVVLEATFVILLYSINDVYNSSFYFFSFYHYFFAYFKNIGSNPILLSNDSGSNYLLKLSVGNALYFKADSIAVNTIYAKSASGTSEIEYVLGI